MAIAIISCLVVHSRHFFYHVVNYPFGWLPIWSTEKYIRDKTFMNSETKKDFMKEKTKTPNDYVDDLKGFITQFNLEME